jgi:hypothetical protein
MLAPWIVDKLRRFIDQAEPQADERMAVMASLPFPPVSTIGPPAAGALPCAALLFERQP